MMPKRLLKRSLRLESVLLPEAPPVLEPDWKHRAMERTKVAKELLIERDAERDLADKLADALTDLRTRLAAMGQGGPVGKAALDLWRAARTLHSENTDVSSETGEKGQSNAK